MDFTRFSDENFDLKDWINGAFKTQKDTNQNLEQFVATQITKLQVFIQEINNLVDDTSQQTIQNFPRILREIEALKQETSLLKEQMKNVREDLLKVEKNTVNDSMKLLLDLDIIRTNMINVQMSLQEADNWSTLSADLDSVLQTRDLLKITNHIEQMQNSLVLLQDSADYVSRCTLLEDAKNKFETLMSPDIIVAFNSKSIDSSKNFVSIFDRMNRLNELKKYYYQCEKAKLLDKYNTLSADLGNKLKAGVTFSVEDQVQPSEELAHVLKSWLDYSIEIWHHETQWCKQIFDDAHGIVMSLLIKCFEDFYKNFTKFVDQFLADQKNQPTSLECLNQLKQEVDRFVAIINSSAESSSLNQNSVYQDHLHKLYQQIYQPFMVYIKQYGQLELKYLQNKFETNIKMIHSDTVECIELLSNSVTKVFNLIDQEIERCVKFTNGCGFSILIDVLKVFLKNYIEDFKRIVINLKERKKQGAQNETNRFASVADSLSTANSGVSYGDEDWDTFRHFVRVIQIVGDLIVKYENLEEVLEKQIKDCFIHSKHHHPSSSLISPSLHHSSAQDILLFQSSAVPQDMNLLSVFYYKDYLLEESDKLKLNNLISVIESGDDYSIMKDLLKPLYTLSENVHKYAFDVVFAPIKHLLGTITKGNLWQKVDVNSKFQQDTVPLFALAPQEYITKIGQYILTLPQNFEPFTMQDNLNLKIALKKGKLPHLDEKDLSEELTACWLDSIANATVVALSDEILKIPQIRVNSQRQLIIDIEFICSVFEDVDLKDYYNLRHILDLLKAEKDDYENVGKDKPVRVVSAIRKMRSFS